MNQTTRCALAFASMRQFLYGTVSLLLSGFWTPPLKAQPLMQQHLEGHFLDDSIEIGRPFRYSLTYRHPPAIDLLFPDTTTHFRPYRVNDVTVFSTKTDGSGAVAISRDSAVYTLVSFETDSVQLLQVPIRILNPADCTILLSQTDTVFLRSKLRRLPVVADLQSLSLATETELAPLQQQFNYPALGIGALIVGIVASIVYGLFWRGIQRQWQLYQLNRQHNRFLRDFNRLSRTVNAQSAADVANQAVIMWKMYLEQLEHQSYVSLTTPELAERMNDSRVTNALREADQMIYGGVFSAQSQPALRMLSEIATEVYHRRRHLLQQPAQPDSTAVRSDAAESSSVT